MTMIGDRHSQPVHRIGSGPPIMVINRSMGTNRSQICCEFTIPTLDNNQKDVTVFEAYWAPLTEGKIGFWQTVWFLFVSALWGLLLTAKDAVAMRGFRRWVFN